MSDNSIQCYGIIDIGIGFGIGIGFEQNDLGSIPIPMAIPTPKHFRAGLSVI